MGQVKSQSSSHFPFYSCTGEGTAPHSSVLPGESRTEEPGGAAAAFCGVAQSSIRLEVTGSSKRWIPDFMLSVEESQAEASILVHVIQHGKPKALEPSHTPPSDRKRYGKDSLSPPVRALPGMSSREHTPHSAHASSRQQSSEASSCGCRATALGLGKLQVPAFQKQAYGQVVQHLRDFRLFQASDSTSPLLLEISQYTSFA